jgi:2-amino-4-hydroxy-6-hydroxymethyldihydropteridine diphosphokinase
VRDFAIGLGSNLGSREAFVRLAARLLCATPGIEHVALSRAYVTEPLGPPQPHYLNAAVRVRTALAPQAIFARTSELERSLGRVRDVRFGPRTIDLDVLWWEGGAVEAPDLHIPHRALRERAFALAPLLDVVPELAPELGPVLARLAAPEPRAWSLPTIADDRVDVRALDDADALALALDAALGAGVGMAEPISVPNAAALVRDAAGSRSAVVERLGPDGAVGRLIRAPNAGFVGNSWDLLELEEGRCVLFRSGTP